MANKYWRGGAYTDRGVGAATDDGNWDYEGTTYAISAAASANAGSKVKFTCADHGGNIVVGESVTVTGTTDYNGTWVVDAVADTTHFTIVDTYVDSQAGDALSHYTSNWVLATGIGAVKPAGGETVIFSDRAGLVSIAATDTQTKGRHWSVDSGLDQKATDFTIIVESAFNAKFIGYRLETATPTRKLVPLQCTAALVLHQGESEMHLAANDNADPGVNCIDEVIVDTSKGSLYLYSMNNSGTQTDEITDVVVREGTVHIVSSYDSTEVGGVDTARSAVRNLKTLGSKATVYITEGLEGGTPAEGNFLDDDNDQLISIDIINGTVYCDSGIYECEINAGQLDIGSEAQTAGTTLYVGKQNDAGAFSQQVKAFGGTINWRSKGTIGGLEIHNALIYALGNEGRTLGDSAVNSGTIEMYGGTLDLLTPDNPVALGGSCEVHVNAGTFAPPKRTDISW